MRHSPALSPALTHCLRTLSRDLARTRNTLEGVKHARGRRARSLALLNAEVDLECCDEKLRDVLAVYDEWGSGEDHVLTVARAVAAMEMPTGGPTEDPYCPFECGWSPAADHAEGCPVTLARRLIAGAA